MKDLFKDLRVLVTGDTGFKGSWLWEWLLIKGASVYGLELEPHNKIPLFNQLELEKRIRHENLDIRDFQN